MSNDTNPGPVIADPHQPNVVNLAEPWTRAYWARTFEVPVERLEAAVAAIGTDPETVAAHLGRPWPIAESGIV